MTEVALRYPRLFASLVKIEHTIFALPFAYIGAFLAVDGIPSAHDLLWITVAMVGRAQPRDGAQPAHRRRASTRGTRARRAGSSRAARSRRRRSSSSASLSLAVFLVAVFQLAPIVHWLWPIPVAGSSSTPT